MRHATLTCGCFLLSSCREAVAPGQRLMRHCCRARTAHLRRSQQQLDLTAQDEPIQPEGARLRGSQGCKEGSGWAGSTEAADATGGSCMLAPCHPLPDHSQSQLAPTHPRRAYPPTHPPTHPPSHLPTHPPTHPPTLSPTHPPTHPPVRQRRLGRTQGSRCGVSGAAPAARPPLAPAAAGPPQGCS